MNAKNIVRGQEEREALYARAHELLDEFLVLVFSLEEAQAVEAAPPEEVEEQQEALPFLQKHPDNVTTIKGVVRWYLDGCPEWGDSQIVWASGLTLAQVVRERNRYETEKNPARRLTYAQRAYAILQHAGARGVSIEVLTKEMGLPPEKVNSVRGGLDRVSRDGGIVERIKDNSGWYRARMEPEPKKEEGA